MKQISILGLHPTEYQFWNSKNYSLVYNSYNNDGYYLGVSEGSSYQHPFLDKLNLFKSQKLHCGTNKIKKNKKFSNYLITQRFYYYTYNKPFITNNIKQKIPNDYIWVEKPEGIHRISSFILSKGEILWNQVAYPYKTPNNDFDHILITTDKFGEDFVKKYFIYYTGELTIEFIGNIATKIQCYIPNSFLNLYNLENFIDFIITNHFCFSNINYHKKINNHKLYSWHYYNNEDIKIENIIINPDSTIKSIQTFKLSNKIAIINTEGIVNKPPIFIVGKNKLDKIIEKEIK